MILLLKEKLHTAEILTANSYDSAVALLKTCGIDMAVLDINLGGKNGIELLIEIKAKYPVTKVVMFSNNVNHHYGDLCKKGGADYFLDKSKDFELISEIAGAIV